MLNFKDYNVGDRVVLTCDDEGEAQKNYDLRTGMTGTVVELYAPHYEQLIGVEWDQEIYGGHTCSGEGERGHCWRVEPWLLDLVNSEPIEDTQLMEVLLC